ncbi:hypothetical protein [Microbacterium sp. C7(2022)]|uniref:hypothetical protein n=1 Tax=Microbacterium sp. C7(2022) TaxID=2992759 RepID=UPI00237B5B89|nr:hypothetical protein [Microbacterium sp. C7(2022)]MDE0547478.1 hypothetical protein [Microbacterium sp. C7(2022)]
MSVKISYDELGTLYTNLLATQTEFEEASKRRSDLGDDIGRPYDRGELRDKTNDFESRWDDRRNKLNEGLKTVTEHTKAVLEGFGDFDTELAAEMAQQMQDVD